MPDAEQSSVPTVYRVLCAAKMEEIIYLQEMMRRAKAKRTAEHLLSPL